MSCPVLVCALMVKLMFRLTATFDVQNEVNFDDLLREGGVNHLEKSGMRRKLLKKTENNIAKLSKVVNHYMLIEQCFQHIFLPKFLYTYVCIFIYSNISKDSVSY